VSSKREIDNFWTAIKWVEQNLSGVVLVNRSGVTSAEIDEYAIAWDGYDDWSVSRIQEGDADWERIDEGLDAVDAVLNAMTYAMRDAMDQALSNPSTCPEQ
jgi:hypothetical protein